MSEKTITISEDDYQSACELLESWENITPEAFIFGYSDAVKSRQSTENAVVLGAFLAGQIKRKWESQL